MRSILVAAACGLMACGVEGQLSISGEEGVESVDSALTTALAVGTEVETTASVNFRTAGSTSASIIRVISSGTRLKVTQAVVSGAFFPVTDGTARGWVSGKYLRAIAAPTPTPAPSPDCVAGDTNWACTADGSSLKRCNGGRLETNACARGCLRASFPGDAECLGTTDNFQCSGSYGTVKSKSGDYHLTAFGCWTDANGVTHGDSGDNCIPTCFAQAKAAGLCLPGDTGKACEERVTYFTADAARFGCLARVKITNPANGKSVVAVALDYGPACWVEIRGQKAVLDASGRVNRELFGVDQGESDRALVHVVEVDKTTPLGPVR